MRPHLDLRRFSLKNRCHPDFPPREGTKARKPTGEQSEVGQAGLFQKAPEFGDVARVPKDILWMFLPEQGAFPRADRERTTKPYRHTARVYKNKAGNPLNSWTDAHQKKKRKERKRKAFLLF